MNYFILIMRSSISDEKNCYTSMFDAFLLAKATGEVINERVESAIGEFLDIIGRLQADQLKHISQFQVSIYFKYVIKSIYYLQKFQTILCV